MEEFIFFWGNESIYSQWHKVDFSAEFLMIKENEKMVKKDFKDFLGENSSKLLQDGKLKFNCCEQFMMFGKALLFNDLKTALMIMATTNQEEQKELGRVVQNFDPHIWRINREIVVYQGNYHKFSQNQRLLSQLLNSKGKILVKASPDDKIWGIGLSDKEPEAKDIKTWCGLNLLGYVITKVRDDIEENRNIYGL